MSEDDVQRVVELTNRILEGCGLELSAEVDRSEDGYTVEITGPDVPILLGHNAELLDALAYMGNRMLTRGANEEGRLVFDSGGYRAAREKELRLMAEKAAERVRTSHRPFTFDPMSPNERRIIHLALADDATVTTESAGGGEERKVVVYPR